LTVGSSQEIHNKANTKNVMPGGEQNLYIIIKLK